jgi:hypothetical protein
VFTIDGCLNPKAAPAEFFEEGWDEHNERDD